MNKPIQATVGASAGQGAVSSALLGRAQAAAEREAIVPVFTLVLWSLCLGVGVLGWLLPYAHPRFRPPAPQPTVQAVQVELKAEPPPPTPEKLPAAPRQLPTENTAPAPLAVAQPSPAIAFAVPVAGPVRVVPLNQAAYAQPAPAVAQPPKVQTLTFGEGAGRQPAPEYPRRALQEHQQGLVVVRFVVGENGRVSSAEATQPCLWPALNEAALRTIRERWQFPAGALRIYEIAIRFQLSD